MLEPNVLAAYVEIAEESARSAAGADIQSTAMDRVTMSYRRSWSGTLADALAESRRSDVRRGASTVGPQRDELILCLGSRDARSAASQGEQRTFALALRLGVHRLVTERTGAAPLLLLDDVFSELDAARSHALLRRLPLGQSLLTSVGALPDDMDIALLVDVRELGCRP